MQLHILHRSLSFCITLPGQTALELAQDSQMQQVLCVRPVRQLQKSATRFEGQLLKRSRFLGWKPIWVSFTSLSVLLSPQFPFFLVSTLFTLWCLGGYMYNNAWSGNCPPVSWLSNHMHFNALSVASGIYKLYYHAAWLRE